MRRARARAGAPRVQGPRGRQHAGQGPGQGLQWSKGHMTYSMQPTSLVGTLGPNVPKSLKNNKNVPWDMFFTKVLTIGSKS